MDGEVTDSKGLDGESLNSEDLDSEDLNGKLLGNRNLLHERLSVLEQEHRDLDDAIMALEAKNSYDQLQIQRLKKRKLRLRDQMAVLHDMLVPDIIA